MDQSLIMIFAGIALANLFGVVVLCVKLDQIREKIEEVLRWI